MPLPTSGPIGADDINDDIGNQANSQLDIDQIATIVYNLSRPHGFDEFYGLTSAGAENIDVLNTPILIDAAGAVYTLPDTVRADDRYNIVVNYEADTELQWATGFIYSVSVIGTLGVYPSAEWLKAEPENAVPFTGPFNSYRTLIFGSFPNDIGNYSRIGYINFVGSVTGVFVVQQQANLFWATVMGSNSWGFVIPQGSTSNVSPLYELTAGPNSSHGGYNPESFFLTTTFAPTGEDPEDWIEGRSRKQAEAGYTTWYSFRADGRTIFSSGPDDYVDIRAKQVNNTYHDIVFTIYFNADLIDKAQESEWLNRLPITIRLEGLEFTFQMTPSFTQIPRGGGSPTITFNLASGTWDSLSADRSWVSFGKTSGTANDSTVMTIGQNPETNALNITVSARSSVTGEYYSFIVSQAGLPLFTSSMIEIGNWYISSTTGQITLPPITIPFDYPYTISYSSGYIPQVSGWPVVSTPTIRAITVSVVVPNDGFYGNPGQTISNSSTRTQQPNHTITVDSISPTTLGNFAGAFTTITVTSSTTWSAQCYSSGFRFTTSQGGGVTYSSASQIFGTAGTRTVYVETTSSTTTSRNGSVYFYTDTGGGTATATFTQEGQPTFDSSDWTGGVSISSTTGNVSISTGNSTTTPSVSPTSFPTRTTSTPNRTVTVSNVTAPSGWSNSGTTLDPFNLSVYQAALPRTLTATPSATTIGGSTTSILLDINDVYYTDTSWTLTEDFDNTISSLTFSPSSGTGDSPYTVVSFGSNTSGGTKYGRFTLSGGDSLIEITITQNVYVAPPSISITSVSPSGPYSYEGQGNIFVNISRSGGTNYSAQITPSFNDANATFPSLQPSGITWNNSTSLTITTGTSFYVDVPARSDGTTDTYSSNLVVNASNSGGSDSDSYSLEQMGLVTWNTSPSSLSFGTVGGTQNITLNSSFSWNASVIGTGFSINTTSGTAGTRTISVTATQKDLGGSGTVTFSASGQSDIVVSLSQAAAPLEWDWFVNGLQRTGASVTVSPSTINTSYSVGLYTYRGSTAVASTWMLQRTAGTWITINTTTSGGTSFKTTTSSQNTNGVPNLYLNVATNTGSARNGSAEISIDGAYVATIDVSQSGVSGGTGGGDRPTPGEEV